MSSKLDVPRIAEAIRAVEARSSAELVVEVRSRSGSYAHADARFAALVSLAALIVLVFMPVIVPPIAVILVPLVVYPFAIVVSQKSAFLRRLFTREREQLEAVRMQAAALFHERGIANTSEETGVLLFASQLERRIEVLADRGLLQRVNPNEWNAAVTSLHAPQRIDTNTIVAAIELLAPILARDLPAGATNVDELTGVHVE